MKTHKKTFLPVVALLALLAALAGCESDAVAPQDQLPPPSRQDTAIQSGMVAYAISEIGPRIMAPAGPNKVVEHITWTGEHGLTGTVHIDYRLGPDGTPAAGDVATWAHLFTDAGAPVIYTVPGLGGQTMFDLDVTATLDQVLDQATILAGSGGTMTSGDTVVTFEMLGIVVGSGGYPLAGGLTITSGAHVAEVMFNGTNMVTMIVDSADTYFINLDTGEVTTGVPV